MPSNLHWPQTQTSVPMFLQSCKAKFQMESLGLEPVLYMSALLVMRIFLVSHCRDDNPAIADVLAKRAPFFKVVLTNLTRLVSHQGHIDHKGVTRPSTYICVTLCYRLYALVGILPALFSPSPSPSCKWNITCLCNDVIKAGYGSSLETMLISPTLESQTDRTSCVSLSVHVHSSTACTHHGLTRLRWPTASGWRAVRRLPSSSEPLRYQLGVCVSSC